MQSCAFTEGLNYFKIFRTIQAFTGNKITMPRREIATASICFGVINAKKLFDSQHKCVLLHWRVLAVSGAMSVFGLAQQSRWCLYKTNVKPLDTWTKKLATPTKIGSS